MIFHNPKTNPPAPYKDVLLAVTGEEETAEGHLLPGLPECWRYSTGHPVTATVYGWTELPKCPRSLEVTS